MANNENINDRADRIRAKIELRANAAHVPISLEKERLYESAQAHLRQVCDTLSPRMHADLKAIADNKKFAAAFKILAVSTEDRQYIMNILRNFKHLISKGFEIDPHLSLSGEKLSSGILNYKNTPVEAVFDLMWTARHEQARARDKLKIAFLKGDANAEEVATVRDAALYVAQRVKEIASILHLTPYLGAGEPRYGPEHVSVFFTQLDRLLPDQLSRERSAWLEAWDKSEQKTMKDGGDYIEPARGCGGLILLKMSFLTAFGRGKSAPPARHDNGA